MPSQPALHFTAFRLDVANERLWHGSHVVPLRPRAFALLRYLAEHPNRLVVHPELMDAVWGHRCLSESMLRGTVAEIRRAIGDDALAPQVIETASGRGYRFLPAVSARDDARAAEASLLEGAALHVGRERELARLGAELNRAAAGQRSIVWISGEPGIGKTALVEQFLAHTQARPRAIDVAHGHCVEHQGGCEPYLPLLDALARLARGPRGANWVQALQMLAPAWLQQLPLPRSDAERARLMVASFGATRERMARELAAVLEAGTRDRTLVLWLEDLHWCDTSTAYLLALLARRVEAARLMIVGTLRRAEVASPEHPLRAVLPELAAHKLSTDLVLHELAVDQVATYLAARFTMPIDDDAVQSWATVLHGRTDGVPLFLVSIVDDLVARGVFAADPLPMDGESLNACYALPDALRQLLDRQIERLAGEDQRLLGAASVAGMAFTAAEIASAQDIEPARAAEHLERLARADLFVQLQGPGWPGVQRRRGERFAFRHALHRDALLQRLSRGEQARLHRSLGAWKEAAYGERRAVIAAELAEHFESSDDAPRALHYRKLAAQQALQRTANDEAIEHPRRAFQALSTLPLRDRT
jgi:predicted ATPase/DNA-binding winged helix-turn-helix (wHTH) protein